MKNSHFCVYGLVGYDRSAKVRWLLTEMGVDFETKWLDRQKKENESPEFLRLNPMGKIPVLEFDGQAIFESGAICEYLADVFIERGMAPQPGSPDRPHYLQWMYFATATLDTFQTRIMVIEDIPPGEIYTAKLTALQNELKDALVTIDRALEKSSYLVGDRLSAADIGVSYHLTWLRLWSELNMAFEDFPRISKYIEQMKALPSAAKADVFSYKE